MAALMTRDPETEAPGLVASEAELAPPLVRHGEFPVVGIGASAGGLEALESLVRGLIPDGMAYVVVQHFSPKHESSLSEILAGYSPMPVRRAEHGMRILRDHLYVVPPGVMPSVRDGKLELFEQEPFLNPRMTIDFFFRALAFDQGRAAIGVVLSGGGSDGTLGLKEIKAAGGLTFAQDPTSAGVSEMPQSAVSSGFVDFTLPPPQIAEELRRVVSHPYLSEPPDRLRDREAFANILLLVRKSFKLDFSHYKTATLERRIERRMALNRVEKMEDYQKLLKGLPMELQSLFRDLLINVTSFFRDRVPFERLKSDVLPQLMSVKQPGDTIRIWVAGCATGEEAYSVAMCLLEFLGDKASDYTIQIFSTDVDEEAIGEARLGLFPLNVELDVSVERLTRFFNKRDRHYQINKQLRDMVIFAGHNLTRDPPFSRLDLISCRNVLIYMQAQLQRKVLRTFHYALNPSGYLMLGNSETVGDAAAFFGVIDRDAKLYVKKNIPTSGMYEPPELDPLNDEPALPPSTLPPEPVARPARISVQQLADRKILERYGPPGVLVNQNLDVLQFRGRTGPFLEPTPGSATLSLLKLLRPELVIELRPAVSQLFREGLPLSVGPLRVQVGDGQALVQLDLMPVVDPASQVNCALILFVTVEGELQASPPGPVAAPVEPRLTEVERELERNKEYLHNVIAELETTNEELQSSNEELQSANEELQSTNEELQTSKEELQSTNEELATVNEELQNRMTELGQFKDDLYNINESLQAAVLIVTMDLRIRFASSAATTLLGLAGGDQGRPIGHVVPKSESARVEGMISDVIQSLRPNEETVRISSSQSVRMRVSPYRTSSHTIRGAVLVLLKHEPSSPTLDS
jgi:two-component system CheB/CheR fusion protein